MASLIARREVSCVEVIEAHLKRIEDVNPSVNAVVRVLADDARAPAQQADRQVATGAKLGPLRAPDAGFVPGEDRLLAVQLMQVQGPMARRLADVRASLQVMMGASGAAASPAWAAEVMTMLRPVLPANLMGLPSACVPADCDDATGLPIGVLLTGARFRDDQCLDAAEAIEQRLALATPIDPVR